MGSTFVLGQTPLQQTQKPVNGEYIPLDGRKFYKISNFDSMRPFFMTLVSHTDHWLFISSTGGLTAGRKNQKHALFPYYTDDKLTENADRTGSKTIMQVAKGDSTYIWEPFSHYYRGLYELSRNMYKNQEGNILIFEEINHSLGLTFRYSWQFSEKYGFVKASRLINNAAEEASVRVLDGIQNVIPYGISHMMQNERSNLSHAYKKNELDEKSGLGMFMLSAMIVDKAEPSEALRATTVWSSGVDPEHYLLSSRQLDHYRAGGTLRTEVDVRAEPGSYFIETGLSLKAEGEASWFIVSELEQDHAAVVGLIHEINTNAGALLADLKTDMEEGTIALRKLVGQADGLQQTGYSLSVGRHYSNVLFNIMRGGTFEDQYEVEKTDLLEYVYTICPKAGKAQASFFEGLKSHIPYQELITRAEATGDHDLVRVCYEYLPISFSRRHGDPSRPWNKFSIEIRKEDGSKSRYYQGNWRDIFQNWEALSFSFPGYLNSMIAKFVNASTIDGYNPYRITRDGIDWEVIEPDDEWSFIGYWGDHQIIYLLKLLEVSVAHDRNALKELLEADHFVYANVPYRIKSYADILTDPQDTITFDDDLHEHIESLCSEVGADGKLVYGEAGEIVRATLTEKLLLTLLTKLSNFVPEAGIWLNTQRPEWNDANNALVGNGVSMVTLYYIRRYLTFCQTLFAQTGTEAFTLNAPVADLLKGITSSFIAHQEKLARTFTDAERKQMMDELGTLGETFRTLAYAGFNGESTSVSQQEIQDLLAISLKYMDHAIRLNKREDGLYHAYNLITIKEEEVEVSYLYEMLEGQVAVLSAGMLDAKESLEVLDALKNSPVYREDHYSYLLYPNRDLPRFLNKNELPKDFAEKSVLAQTLLQAGDTSLLTKDIQGNYHFSGDFHNAQDVIAALDTLAENGHAAQVEAERQAYLDVFEQMFNHKAFTGRSGTFFGYEGLGSIYWHMVSKLLLATQEIIYDNLDADADTMAKLVDRYYEIRAGIGINKSPDLYGAFPTDAYSHTPAHKGAQQPGMTGQVKEDVINRWAELGIRIHDGQITFAPVFLHPDEFLGEAATFEFFDVNGQAQALDLAKGELGFTYCQVPVVYRRAAQNRIHLVMGGETKVVEGQALAATDAAHLFGRDGNISQITVEMNFSS